MLVPGKTAIIEGHTDNRGSYTCNIKLAEKCAESIRNYLIEKFEIEADHLTTKGHVHTKLTDPNKAAEGRQTNRRTRQRLL